VAESLAAAAVELHVVGGPAGAEELGPGRQLADQLDERLVRVSARLEAEHRGVLGDPVVVDEELLGRLRLQVDEAGGVGRTPGVG